MSTLQKVNLGTPPTAVDGDTARGANTKANANVDVLNTQIALTSNPATITAPQALTIAHVGKRVNINLASAGTVNLPAAATCAADQVIHLRNIGATVVTLAITVGSGDAVGLSKLNAGESVLMDTDGVHAWAVLMRGRSNSDSETLNARPIWGGLTPWDSGNLVSPIVAAGAQTITGTKTFSGAQVVISKIPASNNFNDAPLYVSGLTGNGSIGLNSNNNASSLVVRCSATGSAFEVVNFNQAAYGPITCSVLSQTSDLRLKNDVSTIEGAMQKLRNLRGVYYTMDGERGVGVIAQEVKLEFPELVQELPQDLDGPPRPGDQPLLGVKYANMVGALLQGLLETDAALRSAIARVEALEARPA
ncbi:tail fiber domain-containing protein [Caballeronia sp. LZ001]|uniref:tail fiber domain-containing protein n=1 Tax=Caballeronia sp. LZ001 TaxID=3038553 RepID=UPI002857746A|nr:tail fiber domain-containing protein [Caballeronia sp. LZ001]MDR5801208.1 tail fiber domain-containing protein [Caballeronia sp. LZ001]